MAIVFRVFDEYLNRRVAVKILAPELALDEDFRQRFIRESQLAAHSGPLGRVSARQGDLEPVSGFEPLTVRLQGQSR